MNQAPDAEEDSVLDTVYKWGASWINYAQEQINTFLSPEDLEVVDPDSDEAHKAGTLINPDDRRQQMWSSLAQYIGHDVMSLMSVPIWIMEPFTVLQKMAEIMEYTELLDRADLASSPTERLACVVAFAVTPYGAIERTWKPFNPILGETFELECGNNVQFLAEQVSHHPPIGAAHAENPHFTYDIVSAPKTKFLGNSADIYPYGRSHIKLKKSGEVFSIIPPTSRVCNLIIGRTWIDTFGKMSVINITTGDRADLDFVPCGWFGDGRYEFSGSVTVGGKQTAHLSGLWSEHCDVQYISTDKELKDGSPERLWSCAEKPAEDAYGRTYFCYKCNTCSGISQPLATDSRRRPDLAALDQGDSSAAASWKHRLEEMQRSEKRERESRSESWHPKWFTLNPQGTVYPGEYGMDDVPCYEWNGAYSKRPMVSMTEDPGRHPSSPFLVQMLVVESVCGVGFEPWSYPDVHTNGAIA